MFLENSVLLFSSLAGIVNHCDIVCEQFKNLDGSEVKKFSEPETVVKTVKNASREDCNWSDCESTQRGYMRNTCSVGCLLSPVCSPPHHPQGCQMKWCSVWERDLRNPCDCLRGCWSTTLIACIGLCSTQHKEQCAGIAGYVLGTLFGSHTVIEPFKEAEMSCCGLDYTVNCFPQVCKFVGPFKVKRTAISFV